VIVQRVGSEMEEMGVVTEIVTRSSPKASPGELDHDGKSLL
jgi:hypothetical protein